MDAILDYIVSTSWAFYTAFTILCFIPTLMIMKRPFQNFYLARFTQIFVSLLAFCALMYIVFGPHGYAGQFIGGLTNGNELCLIEEHYSGDGDGGSYTNHRLYVLDLETGKRTLRIAVDSPEILCVKENSVVFFVWNLAEEYDLKTGKKIHEWSKEKGFEKFPELSMGISDLNRSSESYEFNNDGWLTLTAKNGHQYVYNILEDKLYEQQFSTDHDIGPFELDEHQVRYNDPADQKYWFYNFEDKTGELKNLVFHDKNYDKKILEGEYILPKMVSVQPDLDLFIFKHYTTTDYNSAIHTAVGFDHQVKWRLTQGDLQTSDRHTTQPLPGISFPIDDKLILTFGGQVICVNAKDGSVVWKSLP